ncbi:MAG: 3'-5' exonuclease domain-containing protein 2 [Rhodocyclaceae bacterium]|nr:3'-5' exonuclease domain-containing protein 2 [Rhodocyclaceae bacterium]MBP7081792.1 3'-5' exonuclease domain-containing protein 2 [Rhodocyclaceae bacterium]
MTIPPTDDSLADDSAALLITPPLPPYQGLSIDDVVLVDTEDRAGEAAMALQVTDAVGFDTESKPTFAKGEVSTGPHLIQLATDSKAYLFQAWRPFGMDVARAVLESPSIVKVGFGLEGDAALLHNRFGIALANTLDLARTLRPEGQKNTIGARTAVAQFFNQKLQKSRRISTSNWASQHLNERQLLYAADDAHLALRIYRILRAQ